MRRSAIVLAIALAVTGCSSGGEEGAADKTTATADTTTTTEADANDDEAAVRAAAEQYADFLAAGDSSVKSVMAERCHSAVNGLMLSSVASEIGSGGRTITVESVDGDAAMVSIDFENIPGTKPPTTFRNIDGEWLFDGCP